SPFARYYLTGSDRKWRPYGEAGLQLGVRNFSIEENHFALGVERAFNSTTLLNLELRYTNQRGRSDSYGTRGRLNTVLGGVAWKKAAQQHFQAGSFVVGNQLFDASITTSNAFSFNYVNISPSVDYFLTDRLAVQASLHVTLSAFNQTAAPTNLDYQALYANLRGGARYYLTTKSLFNLFAEGGFTYQSRYIDREAVFGDDGNSSHSLRADLGLGASVFINKNTSIDFGVNLNQDVLGGSDTFADGFLRLKFWFD
ncbi:MAG: outer membrane beta-barrel protein, partial [Lewinella sp.]